MILVIDNIINNYLNILSCFILLSVFNLNKYKYFLILIIDILLNQLPVISIFILLFYYVNKFIFKKLVNSSINNYFISIIYLLIFISYIFLVNDYSFNYFYFLKINLFSIIFNIFIYYIYFFSVNYAR